jgi:rubrerythrin
MQTPLDEYHDPLGDDDAFARDWRQMWDCINAEAPSIDVHSDDFAVDELRGRIVRDQIEVAMQKHPEHPWLLELRALHQKWHADTLRDLNRAIEVALDRRIPTYEMRLELADELLEWRFDPDGAAEQVEAATGELALFSDDVLHSYYQEEYNRLLDCIEALKDGFECINCERMLKALSEPRCPFCGFDYENPPPA